MPILFISRNVSPQNPRNPFQISPSYLVIPWLPPQSANSSLMHILQTRRHRQRGSVVLKGGLGWQCTNETYFLPKHRNLFRKKGGFPGRIIMFWPKLFGFRCFGKLFSVGNGRNAEIPKPKTKLFVHWRVGWVVGLCQLRFQKNRNSDSLTVFGFFSGMDSGIVGQKNCKMNRKRIVFRFKIPPFRER